MTNFNLKSALWALSLLFVVFMAKAQCPPGSIRLDTQAKVNDFLAQYPNCTEIAGDLNVGTGSGSASDVTDLSPLNNLTRVNGNLVLERLSVTSINGLTNMATIGGWLYIGLSNTLTNLNGLNNLTSVGISVNLRDNAALTNISGLNSLTSIGTFLQILQNPALVNVSGLTNLRSIGGHCLISTNAALTNINGLGNLNTVTGYLSIAGNAKLTNLNGLNNLTSVSSYLNISSNNLLNDISALQNLNLSSLSGNGLSILNNASLAICNLPNICTYLAGSGARSISGNLTNCIDLAAVVVACSTPICPPGSVSFATQAEVNQFIIDYPNCTKISGSVNFGTANVVDLSPLRNITEIDGELVLVNTGVPNLNGLHNVTKLGGRLVVLSNPSITNLDALRNITSINGIISIDNNANLTDISGIENIDPNLITELYIQNNPVLAVCHYDNICNYLKSAKPRNVSGNSADCASESILKNTCEPCTVNNLVTTNANNCQSTNGSVTFTLTGDCLFSINAFNWFSTSNPTVTISNLSARDYSLYVAKRNSAGLPDFSTLQTQRFTIGINNVTVGGNIVINCAPDITLPFSTTNFTSFGLPQFYGVCGVTNTKISKYEVFRPDGTTAVIDPFDPSVVHGLTPRQEGTYQIKWTITGQNGNTTITKTCTQTIVSKRNADAVFKSPICNGAPIKVASCGSGNTVAQLQVSGISTLISEFGLKNVKINANFPANFNGVINLIAPNGSKWPLTQGTDFPQYNGNTQAFIVNFTSCYSWSNPHVSDNIAFAPNSTFRARQDLQGINYASINPNGVWGLEVCASTNTTWDLNCFELEFGELCPVLLAQTIVGGCSASDKGSVSVSLSQIKGAYCDDNDNNGILNYRMFIQNVGDVVLQPNQQTLTLDATPGIHTLKFGRYFINSAGETRWHCVSDYIIDIPIIDNQKPIITGCRTNQTIQLGSNGTVQFNSIHPTAVTDNCGLKATGLNIRYLQGATNLAGQIFEVANFTPGSSHLVTIRGTGSVEFEYWATDNANNTQICKYILIVSGDPCVNDRVRPVYTQCPPSQLLVLDNNDYVSVNVTDPFLSDNCAVIKESLEIFYLGGTHNNLNSTYEIFNNLLDQGNTFRYDINKEGVVIFKYSAEDAAGNKGYCFSYINTVKNAAPCSNDITPPVITNCPSNVTLTLDVNNKATLSLKDPDVFDNCQISSMALSINSTNGATVDDETSLNYTTFYPGTDYTYRLEGAGVSRFLFSVTDQSGNISVCQTQVTTIPQGNGAIFNTNPVCVAPGVKTYIPVTVNNFNKIGAFSFDLYFANTTGIRFLGLENAGISNVQYNILGNGALRVTWDDPNGNDLDLNPNFKVFDVVIQSDAAYIQPTRLEGRDVVILSSVTNQASVIGSEICITFLSLPKGTIKSPSNNGHASVDVELLSGFNKINTTTTNNNGNYSFDKTAIINKVAPAKNDEWRRGVDIVDVARIRRHFLETLPLDSKYKILAADVNKDGRINVLDVALTNRLFLQKIQEFPNNTSWRFIPSSFGTNFDPLDVNINEFISLNDNNVDDQRLDFISVKVGDVDHNALLRDNTSGSTRSLLTMDISIPDTIVNPGMNIRIPVFADGVDSFSLFSMQINYDQTLFTLSGIESTVLPSFGGGNYNDLDGKILLGWDHPQGRNIVRQGALMYLVFESKVNLGSSELSMSEVNFYTKDFDKLNTQSINGSMRLMTSSTNEATYSKHISTYPNPFNTQVNILVELPTPEAITLTVFDASGKQISTIHVAQKSAKHEISLDDFPQKGLYFVRMQSPTINEVIKIICVE